MSDLDYIKNIIEYGEEYKKLVVKFNELNGRLHAYPSFKTTSFNAIPNEKKREVTPDIWFNSAGEIPNEKEFAQKSIKTIYEYFDSKFWLLSFIAVFLFIFGLAVSLLYKQKHGEFWFMKNFFGLTISYLLFESSIITKRLLDYYTYKQSYYDDEAIILHNNEQSQIKQEVEEYNKLIESKNTKIAEKNRVARIEHEKNEAKRLTSYNLQKNALLQEINNTKNRMEVIKQNYDTSCDVLGVSPLVFGNGIEAFNEQLWWYAYYLCKDNFTSINHKFGNAQDYLRDLSVKLYFHLKSERKFDQLQNSINKVQSSIYNAKDEIYSQMNNEFIGLNSQLFEIGQRINDNDDKLTKIVLKS